jgi:hypothetical protein
MTHPSNPSLPVSRAVSDHGPIYAETAPGRFPVEPWASLTNLVFLVVIVYWGRRLRSQGRRHSFLSLALPLLALGWLAGTVYHATRSHDLWLVLDWVPIVLLILMAAFWLWRRWLPASFRSPILASLVLLLPILLAALMTRGFALPGHSGISVTYAVLAAGLFIPGFLHCVRRPDLRRLFAVAIACFLAALAFRTYDLPLARFGWPHGSHYLWHVFGGAATFFMFAFLHKLEDQAA